MRGDVKHQRLGDGDGLGKGVTPRRDCHSPARPLGVNQCATRECLGSGEVRGDLAVLPRTQDRERGEAAQVAVTVELATPGGVTFSGGNTHGTETESVTAASSGNRVHTRS